MSQWWDHDAGRYRTSLVYKIFYVWGWPFIRWAMFKLPSERAHHLAIRSFAIVGIIDRVWQFIVTVAVVVVLVGLRLLMFIPGFR